MMKQFTWKIALCSALVIVSAVIVGMAVYQYQTTGGGFKLGVDLVGGTILVYEVDQDKFSDQKARDDFVNRSSQLAASLKRRIDPTDLYNVTVRQVGTWRVEIILPTGGKHQATLEAREWQDLIGKIHSTYNLPPDADLAWRGLLEDVRAHYQLPAEADLKQVPRGDTEKLADRVVEVLKEQKKDTSKEDVLAYLDKTAQTIRTQVDETGIDNVPHGQTETLSSHTVDALVWQNLVKDARAHYQLPEEVDLPEFPRGNTEKLAERLAEVLKGQKKDANKADILAYLDKADADIRPEVAQKGIGKFIDDHYKARLTSEEVQQVKDKIAQVGSLEFRILANTQDDKEAMAQVQKYFGAAQEHADSAQRKTLQEVALTGKAPPPPRDEDGNPLLPTATWPDKHYTYSWVELGRSERQTLGLNNDSAGDPVEDPPGSGKKAWIFPTTVQMTTNQARSLRWHQAAVYRGEEEEVREKEFIKYVPVAHPAPTFKLMPLDNNSLLYSRRIPDSRVLSKEDRDKKIEYFVLTRDPERNKEVTGLYLQSAYQSQDRKMQPAVGFRFNQTGGDRFFELTSLNAPDEQTKFHRYLAIILDGQIVSAPSLNAKISTEGVIEGNFTIEEVTQYCNLLNSGALPASLKPVPVSENTMGPTLGDDTITKGAWSVIFAFIVVLAFMLIYYRFSGLVACIALLANLLLTVAFMVLVQATFTLPGLAGLVLMLGMAVDANVLIYERLREERDRGATLALAIRNGYDRAFPTIIDTHLSSIFTAIVLYAVGNDQLKGFGISLTVGLIISLFTSLFMTRLMFDVCLAKGWLRKLSMFKLLSRTNIDFMAIRYYWFTATIILTLLGASIFVYRLNKGGLNIDFVGGTAYSGRLNKPLALSGPANDPGLRELLGEAHQRQVLVIPADGVKQLDQRGNEFDITYEGETRPRRIAISGKSLTPEEVRQRAQQLPDLSVEQIFLSSSELSEGSKAGNKSTFFTVRTTEMERDLVQASIDRLLTEQVDGETRSLLKKIALAKTGPADNPYGIDASNRSVKLVFIDPAVQAPQEGAEANDKARAFASPAQIHALLERAFADLNLAPQAQQFTLDPATGQENKDQTGGFHALELRLTEPLDRAQFEKVLGTVAQELQFHPPPERLENFDPQLASETQDRALYAILASWGAILLYLWFRFGNWTFGLAAVLCLIHDLFFTLGIIAFAHYVHLYVPWLARILLLEDFKIDLPAVAALLTLVGYSVNDTIVVFDRIREVRGKNPDLTPKMINDSVNQTLSRTILTALTVFLVVIVLYIWGGEGVHLFAFVMVVGVVVGTYSSIYIASPLLLIFGEGSRSAATRGRVATPARTM